MLFWVLLQGQLYLVKTCCSISYTWQTREKLGAKEKQIDDVKKKENMDHAFGDKVMIIYKGVKHKSRDKHNGPFLIRQVHSNGFIRINVACDVIILHQYELNHDITGKLQV